jgi:predicted transcriptional regulator
MSKTAPFSMRLSPELKAKLQRLADADRRSLTNYIEVLLEDHAAQKEQARPDNVVKLSK